MSSRQLFACKWCNRSNFRSYNGLQQHLRFSQSCSEEARLNRQILEKETAASSMVNDMEMVDITMETASLNLSEDGMLSFDMDDNFDYEMAKVVEFQDDDSWGLGGEEEDQAVDDFDPSRQKMREFREYVRSVRDDMLPFTKEEKATIELMNTLRKKRATLDTFDAVMEWHRRSTGELPEWMPHKPGRFEGTQEHHSRNRTLKMLAKRYDYPKKLYHTREIVLPSSKGKVKLHYNDCQDLFVRLLTDPRHHDDDFLFFDNDPFAPPPEDLDYVADVNTGLSYVETYKKLITKPGKQILVGNILYTDGLVTGNFDKNQMEELKYSNTLFTKTARLRRHGWQTVGTIPTFSKADTRGKRMVRETLHAAAHLLPTDDDDDNSLPGLLNGDEVSDDDDDDGSLDSLEVENEAYTEFEYERGSSMEKAQDFHRILAGLLGTLRKMEQQGIVFPFKYRGKLYQDVEFVFFTAFFKCDGDEADKLCSHYRSRGEKVANICRYCTIPTALSDAHRLPNYVKLKEWEKIQALVDANDDEALKKISQQNIKNALNDLRWGLHNKQGVHGACPMEMLHMLLLGIFKYLRDGFFAQLGPKSKTTDEINALAKVLGRFFSRQSERDLPKTRFSKGIIEGKIMGKEFEGVLLLLACILNSQLGREKLLKSRGQHFKTEAEINDWALLIETVLQWEAFLKLDQMEMKHVKRLEKKHRYLMYLIKLVCNRTDGMQFKIMKFHGIHHLVQDILNFGVPSGVDTGANESHHKVTKRCAKNTQKDIAVFEEQTLQRVMEEELLDLAICEIEGKCKYEYLCIDQQRGPLDREDMGFSDKKVTQGAQIRVFWDADNNSVDWKMAKMPQKKPKWDRNLLTFLFNFQEAVKQQPFGHQELSIRTEHKRSGDIFRGHPNYNRNGQWNDWAIFDWGPGFGHLPAEIWCFVDLSSISDAFAMQFAGCHIQKGVYAVIESTRYVLDHDGQPDTRSEMFFPLLKEVAGVKENGEIAERRFYLADVEAIVDTACIVPDIGSDKLRYLQLKPRKEWADVFIEWLERPHHYDEAMMKDDNMAEEK